MIYNKTKSYLCNYAKIGFVLSYFSPPAQHKAYHTSYDKSTKEREKLCRLFRRGFIICIKIYSSSAASSAMPSIKFVTTALSSAAFFEVITGLPVDSSIAFLVSPAMLPPFLATSTFS